MTTRAFFKVCLVLIFLNTIVEKISPESTLLNQFHAQKVVFKVPKICNIKFWIENDPPSPFGTFPKNHPIWYSHPFLNVIHKALLSCHKTWVIDFSRSQITVITFTVTSDDHQPLSGEVESSYDKVSDFVES